MEKIIPIKKVNIFSDPIINVDLNKFRTFILNQNKDIKKILIIKWGAMGDVIQSTPIIDDILNNFKHAQIDLNTPPRFQTLFIKDKRFNDIWGFDFKDNSYFLTSYKWLKKVKYNNYDLIIDLQTNDRSRFLLSILKILFFYPKFSIGNHFIFPYKIKSNFKYHINQPFFRLQRTIHTIGITSTSTKPKIVYDKSSEKKIIKILNENKIYKKKFIIFIPGSSLDNSLKRWGKENFIELAEKLINKKKYKILLIGGPDDIEECNSITKFSNYIYNFCNKIDLMDLIPLFNFAKFIVANDTGPTHLAACSSTPIIQITGPTDPQKVKPFGDKICSVQAQIHCKNCYKKNCSHHSCMKGLKPDFIFGLIENNL